MQEENKMRIVKGLAYFREIKPSQWNPVHVVHLHKFLDLVEKEIFTEKKDSYEVAKELFK